MFELHCFRVQGAQFPFHAQGTGFVGAAAGDHAALVAGAVWGDEGVLRIFASQFFRRRRAVRQISRTQPRQELFCSRAERVAELHELVEPRNDAVFRAEIYDRRVFRETQVPKRIDKKSGPAAHFIAKHGNAGTRMVVGLDHDVFQLVAQVLLDGGFVPLFNFGVIGEHADGAKTLAAAALVGGKKFLYRVCSVRAVVQDLRERGMPRANLRQRIAERAGLFRQGIALLAESGDLRLEVRCALFQRAADFQAKIAGFREQRDALSKEAGALRDSLAEVRARHSTLTQILNDRSYTADAVQKLFAANERGGGQGFRTVVVLAP